MKTRNIAIFFAILAAALYAINIPLSKLLLDVVSPTMMAALLYLGAGLGMFILGKFTKSKTDKLTVAELPYTVGMIVLDIAAPILLMLGLKHTNSANASLLNNFEIVATVLMVKDTISVQHTHEHSHVHTHEHRHGDLVHVHTHEHIHSHIHAHGDSENTHSHTHDSIEAHQHAHTE